MPGNLPGSQPGPPAAAGASERGTPRTVTLPEDLERFLPARLWESLSSGAPRRGLLLNALDRVRSILYLLSTYLPAELVQQKLRRPVAGQVRGEMLEGSLLFSDVSGFTALSERLAGQDQTASPGSRAGAEQLTDLMNDHFARMLRIISWSGGNLLKFAGDALLVYFPKQADGRHAIWAVRAALRMMQEMERVAERPLPGEDGRGPGLRMKIGVGSGPFLAASVGSAERMEYIVLGDAVERTMAAEGLAEAGQVIVDGPTAGYIGRSGKRECSDRRKQSGMGKQSDRGKQSDKGKQSGSDAKAPPADFFPASSLDGILSDILADGVEGKLDDFEIKVERRRSRGGLPLSASSHAVAVQMEVVLRQIKALIPFLPPELVERIVAGARQRQVAGEFRPTTVLFANFTGVEALLAAGQGSPSKAATTEATRSLDQYFQAMQKVIARHGGIVSRIDPYRHGSKMLVLFGAPVAHEDDPLRAVSAALAMNEALAALNERWQRRLTRKSAQARSAPRRALPPIQHRFGITRGQTFAGEVGSLRRREYTVMGDDVNLAARLMASAGAGQILVSQRVYDAVAGHIEAVALPAIRVKGKSQPIPVYQPLGPRDDPLARRLQDRKALLGRDAELEAGQQVIRRALAGEGGVFEICGPPGVGKSRLADELATYALARGARLSFAFCRSYQAAAPYAPWISAVRRLLGVSPAQADANQSQAAHDRLLDNLQALGLEPAEYGPPLCTFLGLPQPPSPAVALVPPREAPDVASPQAATGPTLFARLQEKVDRAASPAPGPAGRTSPQGEEPGLWQLMQQRRRPAAGQPGTLWRSLQVRVAARQEQRLHDAICDLLARIATQAPLLILLEDAHWLDPASHRLLDDLARHLPHLPILVLAVGRQEGTEQAKAASSPACAGPVAEAGKDCLALQPLDLAGTAALIGHLLGEIGGPGQLDARLVESIHRQSDGNPLFVEEMVAAMQRSGQKMQGGAVGRQALGSLQDLVLSRVDALPSAEREVARVASVGGTDFGSGAVSALLAADLDQSSTERHLAALEERHLIRLSEGLPAEIEAGDVAYTFRQTLVRDVIYHSLSFARRHELHGGHAAYLEARLGVCPEFRTRAFEPTVYRGPGAVLEQAELLAHHYESACHPLPAARYVLLSAHKALERYAYAQAAACYDRALAVLDRLPAQDHSPQAEALRAAARQGQGDVALLAGDFGAAVSAYEAARAEPGEGLPPRLEASLALVLPTQGRDREAESLARRLWLEQERQGAGREQRLALAATRAWLLWRRGDPEMGDWIGHGRAALVSSSTSWEAGIAALLDDLAGDWPAAQRAYLGLDRPTGVVLSACRQGDGHLAAGDAAAALALFERAAALCLEENDFQGLALARYRQAEALVRQGQAGQAEALLQEALDLLAAGGSAGRGDGQPEAEVVRAALAGLASAMDEPWPAWRWQSYDDALRISLIYCPGRDLERLLPAPG